MRTQTLQKQHDWILPTLALIGLILGGVLFKIDQRLPDPVWEGRELISGLEPRDLTRINLKSTSNTIGLFRQGEEFFVESQNSAPVDMAKFNEILLRLGGLQVSQILGGKPDWDKYSVSDKNNELVIELYSQKDQPKWKIFLGRSIPGKSGRAVRLDGKDEVFLTSEYLYLTTSDIDYVNKEALRISKDSVKNVEMSKDGQRLDDKKFIKDDLLSLFNPLKVKTYFKTGALPQEIQDLTWIWQIQILKENGVIYQIGLAKKDERWFARAQAMTNQSLDLSSPILDMKLITLKNEIDKFNQQKMPWIWELSSESAEQLERGPLKVEKKK